MMICKINGIAITSAAMTGEQIRDTLSGLPDEERKFIITSALSGECKVFGIAKDDSSGKVVVSCKDTPET